MTNKSNKHHNSSSLATFVGADSPWSSVLFPEQQTNQCTLEVSQEQSTKSHFDPCCPRHTVAIRSNLDYLKKLTCLLAVLHALLFAFFIMELPRYWSYGRLARMTEWIVCIISSVHSDWLFFIRSCITCDCGLNCGLKTILVVRHSFSCQTVPFLFVIRPTHSCCPNVDMHTRISFSFVFFFFILSHIVLMFCCCSILQIHNRLPELTKLFTLQRFGEIIRNHVVGRTKLDA